MHAWFISRILSKIRKLIIFLLDGGRASLHHTSCKIYRCFATHGDSDENETTSWEIYRCFATSRRLKRNQTILQDFVPLACNYRSNKRQFSLLSCNLRGRQVSYHLSIVLCVNICNILYVYNKLSHTFINLVFYYHCEQLGPIDLTSDNVPRNKNKLSASLTSKNQNYPRLLLGT